MLDINNFSNAQSQILCNILNDQAFVFVIPLYQREYSWEDNELNKLFYDTTAGFNSLTTATNEQLSATFLGSVIAYNAVSKDSSQSELGYPPGTLKIVIDGQQRLTSLLIFLCVLHERIIIEKLRLHCSDPNNELSQQFPDLGYDLSKDFYKDCSEWLDIEHNILEQITDCLFSFNKHARPGFGYYPKMFREAKDKWSKKDSFYGSQIASLLSKYWKESREIYDGESFNFDAIKAHKEDLKKGFFLKLKKRNKSNLVENAYSVLRERIAELFGKESDQELEIPDFDNLYRSKVLHKIDEAWDYSKSVEEILLNGQDLNLCNYIRFISYVSYVINRICLTVITTTNEDYAFDIFESLNTTGTPLTAYETFKPLVINYAGKDFLCREEKSLLDKIDGYLGKKGNKEQITSTMLIAFANCYSGEKLSRTLKSQRAYLRKYPSLEQDEKDNFLKTLSATALTICNYWDGDVNYYKLDLGEDRENFEDAKVCLKFLNSTKTSVILPLLTRFYQKMEASAFSKESITEFNKVVKAITAFFVFYRSSRKTTDGIDEVFRKILSDDFCVTKSQGKFGSLESLKAKFIEILKEKDIYDKDNWIKKEASCIVVDKNEVSV